MLTHALRIAPLLAAIVSCGGKAIIDPEATTEGGGDSSGTPTSGGSVNPNVDCGTAGPCIFACCVDQSAGNASAYCATDCGTGSSFLCDGREDCDGGRCCGDIDGTACRPTCGADQLERCKSDADCTTGGCDLAVVAGVSIGFCGP